MPSKHISVFYMDSPPDPPDLICEALECKWWTGRCRIHRDPDDCAAEYEERVEALAEAMRPDTVEEGRE